ncbi:SLC35D [Lepeophtheirus salmonis]|uniref:SLC35D n=1 Tax=Lepeophtheirus salmonis TaxID=72036 RepID=A0A7R8H7C4_LEPSM|nr:SLC35D [Lepeophtheirus salmonis]CAF2918114.1 SLC35D [Lepeophtheirus salmonis]
MFSIRNNYLSSTEIHSVLVAIFYGLMSLSMNFLNKVVVSSYSFNYPCFIMFSQTFLSLLILWFGEKLSLIKIKKYSQSAAYDFLLPSVSHALHSTLSLIALKGMNIPMYAALKRCTPLVNLFLSVHVLGKEWPSWSIIGSIFSITIGCLIAGVGDYDFDIFTYTVGALSVLAQGLYLTFVQKKCNSTMSVLDMIFINSWNTLPFFMFTSLILGEPMDIWEKGHTFLDPVFLVSVITLSMAGFLLVYSQFLCTTVCSALTTSLVGVAKSVIQTFVGFFTFGGVKFNIINILGLSLNTLGGIIYTSVKHTKAHDNPLLPKNKSSTISLETQK